MHKSKKIWIALWGVLLFLYGLKIYFSYTSFNFNYAFGDTDNQLYWQVLLDFLNGKALYKNIYWEYSFLPLLIRIPFFLILQKSFFASEFINLVIIPIIGIVISFFIGKELLGKKALLLYGSLLLCMGTTTHYSSIRYLIPELGLILMMIGIEKNERRKILIGSCIVALSLLTSIEYAVATQFGIIIYFLLTIFSKRKIEKKYWVQFVLLELFVGLFFLIYLLANHAFENFVRFHKSYFDFFYSKSPCRDMFPRISDLKKIVSNPIEEFSRWNYYFIPFFILLEGVWVSFQKKIPFKKVFIVLIIYSLFISIRILTTPCYYFYALTFPLLLLSYFIFHTSISRLIRALLFIIVIWLFVSAPQFNIITLFSKKPWIIQKEIKDFLPVANIYLNKKLVGEYTAITNYVQLHTTPEDYVYSHRVGPYNQLTNRKSPVSIVSSNFYEIDPFLINQTLIELKNNPPRYVIINTYNGDSYANSIANIRYNIHHVQDKVFFEGDVTEVEDFISQNYSIEKIFDIAWVLKRRDKPIPLQRFYAPISTPANWTVGVKQLEQKIYPDGSTYDYTVTGKNPTIYLFSPLLKQVEHVEVPIKVDLGILKPFSKFPINYVLITNTKRAIQVKGSLLSSDWSNLWIYIPDQKLFPKGEEVVGIALYISDNHGFLPWGKPVGIKMNTPKLFIQKTP